MFRPREFGKRMKVKTIYDPSKVEQQARTQDDSEQVSESIRGHDDQAGTEAVLESACVLLAECCG